ncbi:MAG: trehalose-6-phosphate synthase [Nitrospirae bacterium]|nr:trehalose-6-phosphate synthase [Nitrospirota bacterium]MBI3593730.1 trehalose-6-phosphate synthase [Nitrospirota bacterium]
MHITFRLIVSLIIVMAVAAASFAYIQVHEEKTRLQEELEKRSRLLADSLEDTVDTLLEKGSFQNLQKLLEKLGNRERLSGVAVYNEKGTLLAITTSLTPLLQTTPKEVLNVLEKDTDSSSFDSLPNKENYLYAVPLHQEDKVVGALAIFHNTAYIQARFFHIWRDAFQRLLVQMVLISMVTLLFIRWSIESPIARMAERIKKLRMGETNEPFIVFKRDPLAPLAREITQMAKSLKVARTTAEMEARLRQSADSKWTPERLKEHVRIQLRGKPLFVISNREPYMHVRKGNQIEYVVPASGLVTALEPVLRACEGTWIAHGSGEADTETVDETGKMRVPPEEPQYILKRVWLTKEEENGYYYGFANEGLWPLCHIAHTRPTFRSEDWNYYQQVNEKFALAALEEMKGTVEPCVLIQDYHFALLARLIKEKRPDARVALFWHIPWPNPESFGICPWEKEILSGMLGADLVGFHIQFHCNNFLDTVDRALESRIDWQHFAVNRKGHTTQVKPFPISIAIQDTSNSITVKKPVGFTKEIFLKNIGIKAKFLGVGVDRIDYTKGILERFKGIERFFEKYPRYQGLFTFVELGAPSRTLIKRYHDLIYEVENEANRINNRFQKKEWKPIVFLKKHHSHDEIEPFYTFANLCLVTSLHDGMNLVAKEFVSVRNDETGVLILSQFTGASTELQDALLINPYDTDQMAEAIRQALEMPTEEQRVRMQAMRDNLHNHNIYRWTAELMDKLVQLRLEQESMAKPV